jgi:hypothetical protein
LKRHWHITEKLLLSTRSSLTATGTLTLSFSHSLTHSLTHSLSHSFTHSLIISAPAHVCSSIYWHTVPLTFLRCPHLFCVCLCGVSNMGNTYKDMLKTEEAITCYKKAIEVSHIYCCHCCCCCICCYFFIVNIDSSLLSSCTFLLLLLLLILILLLCLILTSVL